MEEVIKLNEVDKYNKLFGLETRHPLVSVVDLSKATRWPEHFKVNYGVYALYLKDTYCGNITYGRQVDYQDWYDSRFRPWSSCGNRDAEKYPAECSRHSVSSRPDSRNCSWSRN